MESLYDPEFWYWVGSSDAAQCDEVRAVLPNCLRSLYDPEFLLEVF